MDKHNRQISESSGETPVLSVDLICQVLLSHRNQDQELLLCICMARIQLFHCMHHFAIVITMINILNCENCVILRYIQEHKRARLASAIPLFG